jgi:hypothetical protein
MLVSSVASLIMTRLSIQLAQCPTFDLKVPFMKVYIQSIKSMLVGTIVYIIAINCQFTACNKVTSVQLYMYQNPGLYILLAIIWVEFL